MGLGSRGGSRHETVKTAGVDPSIYWDFQPGQSVMTVDGFPGKVTAVHDGPTAGNEAYDVVLDNNMGGGLYTSGQLRSLPASLTAAHENTASVDYPELADVLRDRPDIGRYPESTMAMLGSLQKEAGFPLCAAGCNHTLSATDDLVNFRDGLAHQKCAAYFTVEELREVGRAEAERQGKTAEEILRAQAGAGICEEGHLTWDGNCPSCRNAPKSQNHMVINEGDHRPDRVTEVKQSSLEDDVARQFASENPAKGDGCTVCGDSDHETHQHVDDTLIDQINNAFKDVHDFTRAEHARQPGKPSIYSMKIASEWWDQGRDPDYFKGMGTDAWENRDDPESPYNPWNRDYREEPEPEHHEASLQHGWQMFAKAVVDPSFAFHFTAAWKDVRNKAIRIRREGGVHITEAKNGFVVGKVKGDHGTYESVLMRVPGTQKVGQWDCGCTWAKYHWGAPDDFSRFAGRMCSHVMALNFECQSRGMFGREISTDVGTPSWLTKQDMTKASSLHIDPAPVHLLAALAIRGGDDPLETLLAIRTIAAVSSPFGEPGPPTTYLPPGPTKPRDPNDNPAQSGFLTSPDPKSWSEQNPGDLGDRSAALAYDESMFEPEIVTTASVDPKEAWAQLIVPLVRAIGPKLIKSIGPAVVDRAMNHGDGHEGQDPEEEQQPQSPGAPGMDKVNDFANKLKSWTDQSKREGDSAINVQRAYSTLHEEPEPALPTTDGADDDMMFEPEPGQTWSGYAGDPDPDPKTAGIPTGVEYTMPSDPSPTNPAGQVTAPAPGLMGAPDDSLSPESPSQVTVGSLQPGPKGPSGLPEPGVEGDPGPIGSVADIVARFQATAGASAIMAKSPVQKQMDASGGMDVAAAAQAFLQKKAMATFSPAEQQELIKEGEHEGVQASNLDRLEITGTHYEHLDALAANGEDDDETWTA